MRNIKNSLWKVVLLVCVFRPSVYDAKPLGDRRGGPLYMQPGRFSNTVCS